jgi:hypothetical protein
MRRLGNLLRLDRVGRDYRPLPLEPGMFGQFDVLGSDIVEASKNYNEATLGWMFGVGQFGQIRLTDMHKVQLISVDAGAVVDRRAGRGGAGGRNLLYRVAICWYLGAGGSGAWVRSGSVGRWSSPMLYSMLSSDFDRWWTKYADANANAGPGPRSKS